jgi:hypothetical protein
MEHGNGVNAWDNSSKIWFGVALGAAVGLGIAFSRRPKKTRWEVARRKAQHIIGSHSAEFADAARDLVQRAKAVYEEGSRIAQDAGELWTRGRKLV